MKPSSNRPSSLTVFSRTIQRVELGSDCDSHSHYKAVAKGSFYVKGVAVYLVFVKVLSVIINSGAGRLKLLYFMV